MKKFMVRRHFVFDERNRLAVSLDSDDPWHWEGDLGAEVDLWVGPDAAFPFRYVEYRFNALPDAVLESVSTDGMAAVSRTIAENPNALMFLTLREPPRG